MWHRGETWRGQYYDLGAVSFLFFIFLSTRFASVGEMPPESLRDNWTLYIRQLNDLYSTTKRVEIFPNWKREENGAVTRMENQTACSMHRCGRCWIGKRTAGFAFSFERDSGINSKSVLNAYRMERESAFNWRGSVFRPENLTSVKDPIWKRKKAALATGHVIVVTRDWCRPLHPPTLSLIIIVNKDY